MFFVMTICAFAGLKEKSIDLFRFVAISITFVIFVVQPLFYLGGDAKFRDNASQKGIMQALKIELLQTNRIGQAPLE